MTFVCDRCARCCRHHVVPVTRSDVTRLARHLRRPPEDFLDLRAPDTVDLLGEPETLVDLPEGRRVVVLAHREGGCVFLESGEAGTETCGVHPHRPRACRTYPFDRPDQSDAPLGLHPEPMCPPETGYLTVLRQKPAAMEWQAVVRERDRELHEHAEWVARFNGRQRLRRRLGKRLRTGAELFRLLAGSEQNSGEAASGVVGENAPDTLQVASPEQVEVHE